MEEEVNPVAWNYTVCIEDRVEDQVKVVDGVKHFQNRPIICRDSPIDGGVYLGPTAGEAIVVDSEKYPAINNLYKIAKMKATEDGKINKHKVLQAVFGTVKDTIPYNENGVNALLDDIVTGDDVKISLDVFINSKAGVCRHQALACGALLEKFKKEGHVKGTPSIDRNAIYHGGHAWCRYTNSVGDVFILDVAQDYLGRLTDAPKDKRWPYERPDKD